MVDTSEAWIRLPFLIAGMAGIICAYFAGAAAGGRVNGLIAAFLLTFSAFHINLSQEARYYAPLMLVYLLGIFLLYRCMRRGSPLHWTLYGIVLALGLLTHLSMVFFFFWANAAAFIYLLFRPGSFRQRTIRILALVLCTVAAAMPLGLRILTMGSPVSADVAVTSEAEGEGEGDGLQLLARNAETAPQNAGKYRLELKQIPQFIREYIPVSANWYYLLAFVFVAVGLIRVWLRNRAMALVLTFLLVGVPIPLLFIHVSHWYNAKYLCVLMVAILLLMAIGVTGLAAMASQAVQRLCKRRGVDQTCWLVMPSSVSAFVLIILLGLLISPPIAHGLREHYAARPETDWKSAARYMAPVLDARDVITYVPWPTSRPVSNTYWKHVMAEPLGFYLERELAQPGQVINTVQQTGASNWAGIRDVAMKNPVSTVWLVLGDEERHKTEDVSALETFAPTRGEFGRISVRVRGGATANLTPLGGFEEGLEQILKPQLEVVGDSPGFSGPQAIHIAAQEPAFSVAAIPAVPTVYPIRNADFEVWSDGAPVGWEVKGAAAQPAKQATSGVIGLGLPPGPQEAVVRQQLVPAPAPGSTVVLSAMAKASAATTLRIALTYTANGTPGTVAQTFTGTGDWQPLTLQAALPRHADRGSLAMELARSAGAAEPVLLDAVTLQRAPGESTLDPEMDYVLSMKMKCREVQAGEYPSRVVKVTLSGKLDSGEPFWQGLAKLEGTRDWERYTFRLLPGRNLPADVSDLRIGAGFAGGFGEFWVDDVQLEAQASPTVFAPGARMPHDEFIAAHGL
jgi:hypothetical protein